MRILSRVYTNEQQRVARKDDASVSSEAARGASSTTTASAQDVRVTVSSKAHELSQRQAIDTQRVDALKASIADGSFTVDPRRIAEALIPKD